jgi:hypothetical protein
MGFLYGRDQLRWRLVVDAGAARNDHGVGGREVVHGAGLIGDKPSGENGGRTGGAHTKGVPRLVDVGALDPEHLAGNRELKDRGARERGECHTMLGAAFADIGKSATCRVGPCQSR